MYGFRFIFTDDIFGEWLPFRGISAKLNNVSDLFLLAKTENVALSLSYDSLLSGNLAESARAREERTVGAVEFLICLRRNIRVLRPAPYFDALSRMSLLCNLPRRSLFRSRMLLSGSFPPRRDSLRR